MDEKCKEACTPMIRSKLQQLMIGRNGGDQLSLTLLVASIVLNLLSSLLDLGLFYWLSLACMLIALFRVFSRNIGKRREENAKFLSRIRPLRRRFTSARNQWQDKEHRYFRCPNCKQQMRVPRGKGRIQVTCRGCGATFEEKS